MVAFLWPTKSPLLIALELLEFQAVAPPPRQGKDEVEDMPALLDSDDDRDEN